MINTVTPPPAGGSGVNDERGITPEDHVRASTELLDHCTVMLAKEEQVPSFGREGVPDGTSVAQPFIDDDIAVFAHAQMAVAEALLAVGVRLGRLVEIGERMASAVERVAIASEDSADVVGDTYDESQSRPSSVGVSAGRLR